MKRISLVVNRNCMADPDVRQRLTVRYRQRKYPAPCPREFINGQAICSDRVPKPEEMDARPNLLLTASPVGPSIDERIAQAPSNLFEAEDGMEVVTAKLAVCRRRQTATL